MSETWKHTLERKRLRSRDGTDLSYKTLGHGPRTLLLCNGLGGRLYAWGPLLDRFADRFRLITWDYRGLFDSGTPPTRRKLSIATTRTTPSRSWTPKASSGRAWSDGAWACRSASTSRRPTPSASKTSC
ncbi:MAG: hypothetical protein R3B99_26540 [Polyangiales bacterium]